MQISFSNTFIRKVAEGIIIIAVFCFWFFMYRYHAINQEMFSIFQNTPDFFLQFSLKPGGWSDYIGSFISQFYQNPLIAAFLQTSIFVVVAVVSQRFIQQYLASNRWFSLAWLPAFMFLGLQMHYDFLFGDSLKVVIYFTSFYAYTHLASPRIKVVCFSLFSPLFFLLFGANIFIFFYLLLILFEYYSTKYPISRKGMMMYIVIPILLPLVWRSIYLINYEQLYSFFPTIEELNIKGLPFFLFLWLPILIIANKWIGRINLNPSIGFSLIINLLLVGGAIGVLKEKCYYPRVELQLHLENATTQRDWNKVLKAVEGRNSSRMSVINLTNLALAQKGELAERLFEYPQIGVNGLIPPISDDYFTFLHCYEIYNALGQRNEAFRFLFEAFVCRSTNTAPYLHKQLAEQLIHLEKYEAAKKYLYILLRTHHYHSWARTTLRGLPSPGYAPASIPSNREDFIMGVDVIGDLLYMAQNAPYNEILRDYLLTALLFEKRLSEFLPCFSLYFPPGQQKRIPRVYEEALLMIAEIKPELNILQKYRISAESMKRFKAYEITQSKENYWFYYQHFTPQTNS